jgi:hypothetical protein
VVSWVKEPLQENALHQPAVLFADHEKTAKQKDLKAQNVPS